MAKGYVGKKESGSVKNAPVPLFAALAASAVLAAFCASLTACAKKEPTDASQAETETESPAQQTEDKLLRIRRQGIFSAGGIVYGEEGGFDPVEGQFNQLGQTRHVDHANVLYQLPETETGLPMVFLHGYGQSRMCFMTTPDGRAGWSELFLRKGHGVYLVDQPGRGEAGSVSFPILIDNRALDQGWYTLYRIGLWDSVFEGSQFPTGEEALRQFFSQMTPSTGGYDEAVISDALVATFAEMKKLEAEAAEDAAKTMPAARDGGILVTHEQGSIAAWRAAAKTDDIKAIVAIEPNAFAFPEDEMPAPVETSYTTIAGMPMTKEDYEKLLEKPIVLYYGDYIPASEDTVPAFDFWRAP